MSSLLSHGELFIHSIEAQGEHLLPAALCFVFYLSDVSIVL